MAPDVTATGRRCWGCAAERREGQALVVLKAMKMEFKLTAPTAGAIPTVNMKLGRQIKSRQLLFQIAVAASPQLK